MHQKHQQQTQKAYSPLRKRDGAAQQNIEHPVLFKTTSIDGSRDGRRDSRSRSKSSDKGVGPHGAGLRGQSVRTASTNDHRSAKHTGAGQPRRQTAHERLMSGERAAAASGSHGLKFVRPTLKKSARNSRSPSDPRKPPGGGGAAPYGGGAQAPPIQSELKGILMNNNYGRGDAQSSMRGGPYQ